jgi:branched-chain amino acid transport system substrate-binding protein
VKGVPLLLLAAALAGCGGSSSESITIAAAGPWTQGFGAQNKRGLELAVSEINARGGIDGRTLVALTEDDEGNGAKAAAIAEAFVANPEVVGVIGHVNSGATVAAARVYDGRLPAISTTASTPDLSGLSRWVFRVISSDSVNGIDLARFATSLGKQRAAILYENDSYGRGLADAFRRGFAGEVIGEDPIANEPALIETHITWLKTRSPDIVFVASTEQAGMSLLREARRQELTADFLGGDGWLGVVADTVASEGAYVGAPFSAEDPRPEAQQFVRAFRARFGRAPDGNSALAYDATNLMAAAIEAVGPDREKIRDWLAGLTEQTAFNGVTGKISFRESGDVVGKGYVMTRVRNGALIVQNAGAP